MPRLTDLILLGPRIAIGVTRAALRVVLPQAEPARESPPPPAPAPSPRAEPRDEPEDREDREPKVREPKNTVPQSKDGGFPEPSGKDPGDNSGDRDPHHVLNTPVGDPDPTEWPDPYDRRPDPLDPEDPDGQPFGEEPHAPVGATSTSQPHPDADPEAPDANPPQRDKLDD